MKAKFGIVLICIGSLLIASALGLFLYFEKEQAAAAESVDKTLPKLASLVIENAKREEETVETPTEESTEEQKQLPEMDAVEIDGEMYIGFISMPTLGLELPIIQDWSYKKLKSAPCRYYGSIGGEDLVLMAHNYASHFGRIDELQPGDTVCFTDMDGISTWYQVTVRDLLPPTAVEEMTSGGRTPLRTDLKLF